VGFDFLGYFVAFQRMLQRSDLETELLGHAQQHQNLVGAVAVRVHQALAFEHFDQRLELHIPARRQDVLAARPARFILLPGGLILPRLDEGFANDVLHAMRVPG